MRHGCRLSKIRTKSTGEDFIRYESLFDHPMFISLDVLRELYPEDRDDYDDFVQEGYWENGVKAMEENGDYS